MSKYEEKKFEAFLNGNYENGAMRWAREDTKEAEKAARYSRYSSGEQDRDSTECIASCFACLCCQDHKTGDRKQHLKSKSEEAPPTGSLKLVAGIDDPVTWAQTLDLTTSQKISDEIDKQEARLYVAPGRILQRLHHLYNLDTRDDFSTQQAEYWQNVHDKYTTTTCCTGSDKASVMAKFLHLSEKMADFYNRKVGEKADQSVYAYTPEMQAQIKEWYKHVQEHDSIVKVTT